LAVTVAVPTRAQVEGHEVGATDVGPNTLNVIVPVGDEPPDSTAEMPDAAIALRAVPVAGTLNASDVEFLTLGATTVSGIPEPHVEAEAAFVESPL
jgi:hypothetical protein